MSKDYNCWNGIGRIGQELSCRFTPGGKAVLNTSIACGDDYKSKETGEWVEQTNWIDLVLFGWQAEALAEKASKGSRIFVSGKLTKRAWQDKDKNTRYAIEVVVNEFQILDKKEKAEATDWSGAEDGFEDSDIPF